MAVVAEARKKMDFFFFPTYGMRFFLFLRPNPALFGWSWPEPCFYPFCRIPPIIMRPTAMEDSGIISTSFLPSKIEASLFLFLHSAHKNRDFTELISSLSSLISAG